MTVQFIDIAGQTMALLPADDYRQLAALAEERADGRAAAAAQARRDDGEPYLPASSLDRILAGESALRVWREHRGLTASALAGRSGVHKAAISRIESGKRAGRAHTWQVLAGALGVAPADIMPVGEPSP